MYRQPEKEEKIVFRLFDKNSLKIIIMVIRFIQVSLLEQPILRPLAKGSHCGCARRKVTVLSHRMFGRGCSLSSFFCQPLVDVCLVSDASSIAVWRWAINSRHPRRKVPGIPWSGFSMTAGATPLSTRCRLLTGALEPDRYARCCSHWPGQVLSPHCIARCQAERLSTERIVLRVLVE